MRSLIIILVVFVFGSCSFHEYKITNLEHRVLNFVKLPVEVKYYLLNPKDPIGDSYKMLVFIDLSDSANYCEETVGTFIGPWISYHKLKDKQKRISYRIDRGEPSPYIVFKNKLYIPDRYNIIGRKKSVMEAKYIEYQLK